MAAAVFTWIVLGALVASIAKLVAWDDTPIGWPAVMAAGLIGSAGGGYLSSLLWAAGDVPRGFDPAALLLAIAGAAVVVYAYYVAIGRAKLTQAAPPLRRAA
jgi:uncharacterized membrane protein YeaQ/YmgE (transglycosylase-associated protein family)